MALKQGVASWPAASAAFPTLSAGWLSFVPLGLLLFAAVATIFRPATKSEKNSKDGSVASPDPRAAPAAKASEYYADRNAIDGLANMWSNINKVLSSKNPREAERLLPELRAAMLSAYKRFDLPRLPKTDDPIREFWMAKKLIDGVMPYLDRKHYDEAREEAKKLIDGFTIL